MHDRYYELDSGAVLRVRTPHLVDGLEVSEVLMHDGEEHYHPLQEITPGDFPAQGFGVK